MNAAVILGRVLFTAAFLLIVLTPAWWFAGLVQNDRKSSPFFRLLVAIGLAIIGYVTVVNLVGRATGNSLIAVWTCLCANAIASIALLLRRRAALDVRPLAATWRVWIGPVAIAVAFGLPQWLLAISTNYWDEVVQSAIFLTAPNQFVEGVFPPRHNAFPDVSVKYHYGVMILTGTVSWLSGLSANVSIDVVSTALWLFVFLFVYFWFRDLRFKVLPSVWGAVVTLLGGGLAWLYIGRLEAYTTGGYAKTPQSADLAFHYDAAKSWFANVVAAATAPSQHLRNADGSISNLPWDIAGLFQQHAAAMGIALTPLALYLLVAWLRRKELHLPLLVANTATAGALMLGHAVYGSMTVGTAGVCLMWAWLQHRSRVTFMNGVAYGLGALVLTFLHGGMLASGAQYGTTASFATLRQGFGYAVGGVGGFLHWNVAGFGVPLILTLLAVILYRQRRDSIGKEQYDLFLALGVFAVVSYMIPQVMFYSTDASGIEEFTEISKFFFCTRFALALLSVYGVAALGRRAQAPVIALAIVASAVTPVAFCYKQSVDPAGRWLGFYRSPYEGVGGRSNVEVQMGDALHRLKKTSHDTFFDASESSARFLNALLIYGGSVFTVTPRAFERNGVGFRLSEDVVARRLVQSSRMNRLAPNAPEESGTTWYYAHPDDDMAVASVIVRSRFAKLVREGYFVKKHQVNDRVLYAIEKPTKDVDRDIEKYWQPRVIAQAKTDWDGDGKSDMLFYDLRDAALSIDGQSVPLPASLRGEAVSLIVGSLNGDRRVDLLVGKLTDTVYKRGKRIDDIQEYLPWTWSYRASDAAQWAPEYVQWLWDWDTPLVADLNHDGVARHIAYRHRTGDWLQAPNNALAGPKVAETDLPLPFAGRFFPESTCDLGLWSVRNGMVTLRSASSGRTTSLPTGSQPGAILVPADFDGVGYDQIAVWQPSTTTWRWRRAADGTVSEVTFGTKTGIPLPWDYNHDGRIDFAYWEPADGKIFVSFNRGRTIDRTIPVPAHSVPAFVNMY